VLGVLGEEPGKVFRLMTVGRNEDGDEDARTVVVSCSDGHRNVFIVHVE
jgi:archaellum component FlaG (FlaF/FlaG flagellin family)